jgi:hypothetical protein
MGMSNTQLYKVVREYLRKEIEGYDDAIGEVTVVSFAICDIDEDIKRDLADYNADVTEMAREYKEDGATHVVRFLMICDADLVDGDDIYFRIGDRGEFIPVSEPDMPALCGDYLDEGYKWVARRSLRCATDIGDEDDDE